MTILEAILDSNLFGKEFDGPDWRAWRVLLTALFGLPMSSEDLQVFRRHTGLECPGQESVQEAWLCVGRRGGKSRIAALVAVYLAAFRDYTEILAPGERGTIMLIAADRNQARVMFGYIAGLLDSVPMLSRLVEKRTSEEIRLRNRISIEVHTASFRAVRGYTIVAAILDEIAFWRDESSVNPDEEILAAIRPGMATCPNPLLLAISSPYARRGALWNAYCDHYGRDTDVLVWQADSQSMNPTLADSVVERAFRDDPARAAAEYGAEFRSDVEAFLSREVVEGSVEPGVRERKRISEISYFGFADPSGGSRDSFTLAVAHSEGDRAVLDAVRERRPPFSPDEVTREFAELLRSYGLSAVEGDRYAGEWPRERFREHSIEYRTATKPKSEIYGELLPALNSGRIALLDEPRLMGQLISLERRTSRSGRDSIDHPPRGYDDVANAAAGALVIALDRSYESRVFDWSPNNDGLKRESPWRVGSETRW